MKKPVYFYTPLLRKALPEMKALTLRRLLSASDVEEPKGCKPKQISPSKLEERLPHIYARVVAYMEKTGEVR